MREVEGLENIVYIDCDCKLNAAVGSDGGLWMWGNKAKFPWVKERVDRAPDVENVGLVSVGSLYVAAVTKNGGLWTAGYGEDRNLGHGKKKSYKKNFKRVKFFNESKKVVFLAARDARMDVKED